MANFTKTISDGKDPLFDKIEEDCQTCGQEIPPKCTSCNQFIYSESEDDEKCADCGQKCETESESEDDETQNESTSRYKIKEGKDGVCKAICKLCKRSLDACPVCKQFYTDNEEDNESEDSDSTEKMTDDEDSEDETHKYLKAYQAKRQRWDL